MTRSSTSKGWPSRPSSYEASGRAGISALGRTKTTSKLASLRVLLVFLAALLVAAGSGLVGTQKSEPSPVGVAATRVTLSALSCTFVARSSAGTYSFAARKWQSIPPSPEADLEAVEADVDDVDAAPREPVRHAHGDPSPLAAASRARSGGHVHRAEETRVASRFAAESCAPRGPPV